MAPSRRVLVVAVAGLLAAAVLGCTPPGPSVEELASRPVTRAPLEGVELLGERRRPASGGGLMGIETFALIEQVWAAEASVEEVADAYADVLAAIGEVRRRDRPSGDGVQLTVTGPEVSISVDVTTDGPVALAGQDLPPLKDAPPGTRTWVTLRMSGRP